MKTKPMNHIMLIILAFVLLLIALSVYSHMGNANKKEKYEEPKLKVMLFYATWCPHCERYLETGKWSEFATEFSKKYDVVFEKYDYDKHTAKGDKYKISSFPTIIAENPSSNDVFTFYGDRMLKSDMEKFIVAALKQKKLKADDY